MKRWLSLIEGSVLTMAGLRIVSASIELAAAITMLLLNDVKKALAVNAMLAVVGPIILVLTMTVGLISLADELSFRKLFIIGLGVAIILYGIYK
jgi:hypothetical protein